MAAMKQLLDLVDDKQLNKLAEMSAQTYTRSEALNALLSNPVKTGELVNELKKDVLKKYLCLKKIEVKSKETKQTLVHKVKKDIKESETASDNDMVRKLEDMEQLSKQKNEKLRLLGNEQKELAKKLLALAVDEVSTRTGNLSVLEKDAPQKGKEESKKVKEEEEMIKTEVENGVPDQ